MLIGVLTTQHVQEHTQVSYESGPFDALPKLIMS